LILYAKSSDKTNSMRKPFSIFAILSASLPVFFLFPGCMKDKITRTFQIRTPIYQVLTEFRKSIKSQSPATISSPGKITAYGKYIFLGEPEIGIHVIDNSDPSHPKNVSFINLPGNQDMAIKGNAMYADAYGDLVSFDISDPLNVVAKNFGTNVFPDHNNYYGQNSLNPDSINVIIGWITKDTTVDYNPQMNSYPYPVFYSCPNCNAAAIPSSSTTGTNGSTARFAIAGNYLYTVGTINLSTFDISQEFAAALSTTQQVDWHVETIFPLKDRLFVGTNNGMYMYDIGSSAANPALIGQFTHARGCDPVIADGDYAYVTINDSSACLGFNNELQVVNIKDLSNASLVKSYQLTHPVGLSKDRNLLFICDGRDGLKIYNATDVNNLQLLAQLKDGEMYDVIAANGLAIVLSKTGIIEYDYSDTDNIHLTGKL
jgi:hypothetical protein